MQPKSAKSDAQLLREYAEHRSESAFGEIVARHTDLVYSAALRQVGAPDLARDISQRIFVHLAQKARSLARKLKNDASLVGWLYRGTRYESLTLMRDDRRRQARERQAMADLDSPPETSPDWERLGPVLDEAMAQLGDADRLALLLRFFKNQDFHEVGVALGISDDAAQKRVARCLEKLRAHVSRRGVATTAAALASALSVNAVQAAPAGLVATLTSASVVGAVAATAMTKLTFLRLIAMKKISLAGLSGLVIAGAVTSVVLQQRAIERLRAENIRTRELLERRANEDPTLNQAQTDAAELDRLHIEHTELLRLRSETAALRQQLQHATNLLARQAASRIPPPEKPQPDAQDASPVVTYQAKLQIYIPAQQSLLTGGWLTKEGKRTLLLVTPQILPGETSPKQVLCQALWIEAPENVLASLGLSEFKSQSRESTLNRILKEEQMRELVQILKQTEGVDVLSAPRVSNLAGTPARISALETKEIGGANFELGSSVDLLSQIAQDGTGIDLNVLGQLRLPRPSEK